MEQWEELSSLLTKEAWISGRVLCESSRWVLVDTSTGLHSDDVISRLKEWRVAGLVSHDISYRTWHVSKEGRINLSVGIIDSGAKAEIRNVDPRFTTGTCKALLSAVGISKVICGVRFAPPEPTRCHEMHSRAPADVQLLAPSCSQQDPSRIGDCSSAELSQAWSRGTRKKVW